jgi:hypothetical protein
VPPFKSDCFDRLGNLVLGHSVYRFAGDPLGQCPVVSLDPGRGPEVHVGVIELSVHVIQWELPFTSVLNNVQDCFGCSPLAYLDILSIGNLLPFAVGLLCLLCARVDGFPVRCRLWKLRYHGARAL